MKWIRALPLILCGGCVWTTEATRDAIRTQEVTTQRRNAVVNSYHKTATNWRRSSFLQELSAATGTPIPLLTGAVNAYDTDSRKLNALYTQDLMARVHNGAVVTT